MKAHLTVISALVKDLAPGVYIQCLVVAPTEHKQGVSKPEKGAKPYKISTTKALVGSNFAEIFQYSDKPDADHVEYEAGKTYLVAARSAVIDREKGNILRVSV